MRRFIYITTVLFMVSMLLLNEVYAEGTKQMTTTSSANNIELQINRSSTGGFASKFAGWTATSVNDRLFIHINDYTTEKIYLGFKKTTSSQTVYYRIKRPDGTVVAGPTAIPTSGAGFISGWSQANIGPSTLTGNSGGYSPSVIDLNASAATHFNGDYYIEFNATSSTTGNTTEIFLSLYDVTVANGPANTDVKAGRLWSYNWGFNSNDYTYPNGSCYGSLYVYSADSIVTEVDLNGLSPYYFRIFANSTGVANTGNITADRKSVDNGSSNPNEIPEFKIFLNNPDVSAYPSAIGADRAASFNSFTGCPGNYCFNITVNGDALAELRLDLNNNGSYGDAVDRMLEANVTGGQNCIPWDGKDGLGNNVANNTTFKLDMYTKVGTLHIPVYDAEENNKGFLAAITRPAGIGTMTVYWDDSQISGGGSNLTGMTAGAPQTGTTTVSGAHTWLDPFGNTKTINTWFTTKKTVINNYSLIFATYSASVVSQSNVLCYGAATGSATAAAQNGTTPYTYSWNTTPVQTTATATNLAAGTYTCTVTDATGCSAAASATITQPASAISTGIGSQSNVACFGSATGSVTVTATGGGGSYQYKLGSGSYQSSGSFSGLTAGSYTVTVKDANNCTTVQAVTITQPSAALSVSAGSQSNVACYGGATGSVTMTGTGGTSPYQYKIGSGSFQSSGVFGGLTAGSYTITVKDAANCTATQTVTITQPGSALSVSCFNSGPSAYGVADGSAGVNPAGGTTPYSYSWNNGATTSTVTGLTTGTFTVVVTDGHGCTATCSTSLNNFPLANPDNNTTSEDVPVSGSVTGNDINSADGGNTWSLVTNAVHGTVIVNANGTYTYTPGANYNGNDQFVYKLCDVNNDCDTAIVHITITSVNDLPLAVVDNISTNEDTPVSGSVTGNDILSGDGGNVWSLLTGAAHGTVIVNANGTYTYTPDANYNGNDQFIYQLCDADSDCDTAIVHITIASVDDMPVANADNSSTNEDTPVSGSVTGNDNLSGDGGNVWSLLTGAAHGTVVVDPNGSYTYAPDANYNGNDQFIYQLCDTDNDCDTAIVHITITPVNDPPVANPDLNSTNGNTAVSGTVAGNDSDPDGNLNTGSYTLICATCTNVSNGTLIFNNNGSYTYTPNSGFSGTDQFIYQVCDNGVPSLCDTAVVSITVVGVPVTPSVVITTPNTAICAGTSATFTATPVNGGTAPVYQWKKNGNNVGTNSAAYTTAALVNGDAITVEMTSNAPFATPATVSGNTITMTVNAPAFQPGAFTVSSSTIYWGQNPVTYTVPNTAGVTYTWSYSGTGVTISGSGNSVTLTPAQGATSGTLSVTATNGCGTSPARTKAITVLPYMTWECNNNTDWNNGANWDGGFVPYGTISVLIPASAPCQPVLPSSFCVRDLMVQQGASVTIPPGSTLCVSEDFDNDGVICSGTVVLTGTASQALSGHGTVCNLELNNPNGGTITPGDTVHIREHYIPTDGVLTTNGGLELLSDSTGTATIGEHPGVCSAYISGNVVVNKWIHGGRRAFRFLAHPFSTSIGLDQLTDDIDITGQGGAANGFTTTGTNNPSAFWYNTLTGNGSTTDDSTGWIPFTNVDGQGANAWNPMQGARILIRGQKGEGFGCCAYSPAPVTLDMTGPVNQCDVTVTAQANANLGYNFIGNPYASNIDLSLSARGSALGANFAVWDPNQGVFGAYICQPFEYSYILPAYSSFIVTSNANSNNTITFHESDKTSAGATDNLFKTTGSFGSNAVQLKISSNNDSLNWDRLLLFFDNQANTAAEAKDAKKLANPSLDFYTLSSDAQKLSVDFRPLSNNSVVQLGLRADSQRTYRIKVADYDVTPGIQLYLKDKFLNQTTPMTQGMSYSFQVNGNPLSQGDNRFEITAGAATGIAHIAANDMRVKLSPNPATEAVKISFEAAKSGNTVIVMTNMMGQQVYRYEAGVQQAGEITVPLTNYAQGMYVVTISCGEQVMMERLMVK